MRKWFKTRAENGGMKPINVEILLCLSLGISSSYYRLTETDLLEDYWKVLDQLTFDKQEKMERELQRNHEEIQEEEPIAA